MLFRRVSLIATVSTYFLIFIGGLVRVSGAGLGCPDWPKCFGRWIPPLSAHDLPPGFNAQTFNVTLAWIEYINRLIGVIVGFLILATAILAILYFRKHRGIVIPAVLSAILVAFQGWLGSVVVTSQLAPIMVSLHLIVALIIVSLLIYSTQSSFHLQNGGLPKPLALHKNLRTWIVILWAIVLVQIILGTQLRSQIETTLSQFPLLFGIELIQRIGLINYVHSLFGITVTALAVIIAFLLLRKEHFRLMGLAIIALPSVQVFTGSAMELFGLPALLQVFHLWIASLTVGLILIIYSEVTYYQD